MALLFSAMLFEKVQEVSANIVIAFKRKNIRLGGKKAGAVYCTGGPCGLAVQLCQCLFIIGRKCCENLIV